MPILGNASQDDMQTHTLGGGNFGFSATRVDRLKATEYTLVGIEVDRSGSTAAFRDDMEKCLGEIVKACRLSPRADNLLMRVGAFDNHLDEIHGFKPLLDCAPDHYQGALKPGGMTSLYDATYTCVEAVRNYGKSLYENDYDVNGILFVITDGCDNTSTYTPKMVKDSLARIISDECLQSVTTVLIGVNINDSTVSKNLKGFKDEAGFDQYIELENASERTLAKLASFVSKSISSKSQSINSNQLQPSISF